MCARVFVTAPNGIPNIFGYCLMLALRTHKRAHTHISATKRKQNAFISTSVNIILIQFVSFIPIRCYYTLCRSMGRNISFWCLYTETERARESSSESQSSGQRQQLSANKITFRFNSVCVPLSKCKTYVATSCPLG